MKLLEVCVLSALLVTSIQCRHKHPNEKHDFSAKIKNGYYHIDVKNNRAILTIDKKHGTRMRNVLFTKNPTGILGSLSIKKCIESEPETVCIVSNEVLAKIKLDSKKEVIKIDREVNDPDGQITDCFQLNDGTQWFAGPEIGYQHWPIQNMYYEEVAYLPTDPGINVVERYWLSSQGVYIYASQKDPLFIDQNNHKDKHLCLVTKNKIPYPNRNKITLSYEIGIFKDPKSAHKNVIDQHFGKPSGHPNPSMVEHPIWSTWAQYKVHINETIILKFAQDVIRHGFKNSQLEIDDNWETCYGSAVFDPVKFPDIPRFMKQLKDLGFNVTLWIHPFINEDCKESYEEALQRGYFVKNHEGNVHTTWWQGKNGAGAIDFTNQEAIDWWVKRLNKIKSLGVDSFKFDAGESNWLPKIANLNGPMELQPGLYTKNYTTNLAKHFDDRIEVRSAWGTQTLPVFVRMLDKDSRFTWHNGLPTLITTLLQMNLNGYVFVLPDMIGGNGDVVNMTEETKLPPKNLFIRWLQANVFMPSLQFSFVPWQYDNETIEISKKFTKLHSEITPTIIKLMKRAVTTGDPINSPIWWVDPLDSKAHKIYDEFLLGEEYLIAPVIEENAIERDIYLPAGKWRDEKTKKIYTGPTWLQDYPAPLDTLPYFKNLL